MSGTFSHLMGDVCRQALINEFEALEREQAAYNDMPAQPLTAEEVTRLAQKIRMLPIEYINTLFFKYYFGFAPADADAMLATTHSAGRLRYARKLLSHLMGLDNAVIDEHSIRLACEAALPEYIAQDVSDVWRIPRYSKAFRKKLRRIKAAQESTRLVVTVMKRVAVFILICAISFSTALVANAKWRQRFLNWVVETFPQFSVFTMQAEGTSASSVLSQHNIVFGYLPGGYKISDVSQVRTMLKYNFLSEDKSKMLAISFEIVKPEVKTYYNTENSELQLIDFKNFEAYTWRTGAKTYFVWVENDIECRISGNLDYKEIVKIAENIEF